MFEPAEMAQLRTLHLASSSAADAELQRWAEASGVRSMIAPATFGDSLRGAAATEDIAEGDCVVSVPEALLITAEAAAATDFGAALCGLPLDEQSRLLLWLMVERHDDDSAHAPFWRALPQRFCTGLGFDEEALALLEGTPAHSQCAAAVQHIRAAADALEPAIAALLQAFPQHLKSHFFDWQSFLWATEFWYSYAMKTQRTNNSGEAVSVEAVAPYACLLNHSAPTHVRQWQLRGGRLELEAATSAAAGQQVFLSYGPQDNAHFLTFYGFVLPDNPNEVVTLSFKVKADRRADKVQAVLERLGVALEHRVSRACMLDRVLTCLRVLHANEAQLESICETEVVPTDNDSAVWLHLRTALTVLRARLCAALATNAQCVAATRPQGRLAQQYIECQVALVDELLEHIATLSA